MDIHPFLLHLPIPRQRRPDSPHCPLRPVRHSLLPVFHLALGLLGLALSVLFDPRLSEGVAAGEIAQGFLG